MRRAYLVVGIGLCLAASVGLAQDGPYKVLKTAKVGGDGGFDYVNNDEAGRKLYVARRSTRLTSMSIISIPWTTWARSPIPARMAL